MTSKTLFVWDLADTLFYQKWNKDLTGAESPLEWMDKKGLDYSTPERYEENFQEIFSSGTAVDLALIPGYTEVLSLTHDSQAFTTGVVEQVDWRAEYLNPKVGFDIRHFFTKIVSTFDFAPNNQKTPEIIRAYLNREKEIGYNDIVYTDNDLENCRLFYEIASELFNKVTIFHFKNDGLGLRPQGWYYEIGQLTDILNFLN